MNIKTAKKTIVNYLSGSCVNRKNIESACKIVNTEASDKIESFYKEIGLHPELTSDCDAFNSMVSEFCILSHEERVKEMPEMLLHFERCPKCRELFWEVKTIWRLSTPEIKCYSEPINVIISSDGIETVGISPPEARKYARAMDQDEIPVREWIFKDDDLTIRIVLTAAEPGKAVISLDIVTPESPAGEDEKWAVSIKDRNSETIYMKMKFKRRSGCEAYLDPGTWILALRRLDKSEQKIWEIPLSIS